MQSSELASKATVTIPTMDKLETLSSDQVKVVNQAAAFSEELVSDAYKMSASQWLNSRYDIKTLADLKPEEIVHGPFAQVIRYEGRRLNESLTPSTFDFYKICLQDHSILSVIRKNSGIQLYPFVLYIIIHELIHIVRFSSFLQNFEANPKEMMAEEARVHKKTHDILQTIQLEGLPEVLGYYNNWLISIEKIEI